MCVDCDYKYDHDQGCVDCSGLIDILLDRDAEIEKLRAEISAWQDKAKNWMDSPEAVARLDGYRELGMRAEKAERERDQFSAALQTIRDSFWTDGEGFSDRLNDVQEIASKALAGGEWEG